MTEFSIQEGDVKSVPSDLLLLKYAQGFFGADRDVAERLVASKLCTLEDISPAPGNAAIIATNGVIASQWVLFLGTPPLYSFMYGEMYTFAIQAIEKISSLSQHVRTVTTTIHGTGYGLDGGEALVRLVEGFSDGLASARDSVIDSITFLTLESRMARMLTATLDSIQTKPAATLTNISGTDPGIAASSKPQTRPAAQTRGVLTPMEPVPVPAPAPVDRKKRVFVAMPYSEEFQNVYEFGIYPAVRNCEFICERVDETHFTGDVLERIRGGIESADLVIADLSEGRPNVYLEVGYAWGKQIPVIFVARKGETLHFDVQTHKCIFYGSFTQFAKDLEKLLRGICARSC